MKHFTKIAFLYLVGTVVFQAMPERLLAQSKIASPLFDSAKAIKEITAQNKAYIEAFSKSDSVAIGNLYARDAGILTQSNTTTAGRAAIIHFFGEMFRSGINGFGYTTTGLWGNDNNLVIEEGRASFALSGGRVILKGRYLLVWKREEGKLKIFRDAFFPDANK